MSATGLFNLSWQRYLTLLFLLLTLGFVTSGIVTLIAANWDYFSDLSKIYGLQSLFGLTVLLGGYCFLRESRRQAKDTIKWQTYSAFFVASVMLGGLFALVGQTYQTGANAWQLFALWSLCQLPFLLLFPNVASSLLLATTTNIAFYLFYAQVSQHVLPMGCAVLINAGLLVLSEIFSEKLHDQHWHILPKVFLSLTFASLFALMMVNGMYFDIYASDDVGRSLLSALLLAIPALIALYVYRKYRFDLFNLVVSILALVAPYFLVTSIFIYGIEGILFFGLLSFILTLYGIGWLVKAHRKEHPENKKLPWVIAILLSLAILQGVITGGIWLFFTLDWGENSTLILGILLFGIAWGVISGREQNLNVNIFAGLFFLIGNSFLGFYLFIQFGENIKDYLNLALWMAALIFTLIIIINYRIIPNMLVRALLVIQLLTYWQITYDMYFSTFFYGNSWFNQLLLVASVLLFYDVLGAEQPWHLHLKPIAWGMVIFGLGSLLPMAYARFFRWYGIDFTGLAENTDASVIDNINSLLQVVTGQFWLTFEFDFVHVLYLLTCALPLITYMLFNRRHAGSSLETLLIASALSLFVLGFIGEPPILYLSALLLLVYWTESRAFFGLLVFLFIGYLGLFYYQLTIPLLYKGVLLVGFAAIFAVVALYLHMRYRTVSQHSLEYPPVFKRTMGLVGAFVICLLGAVNYKVQQFEDVLATGKSIILEIAPVDPRSLMQGDYMTLHYAILDDLQSRTELLSDELKEEGQQAYLLLKLDANNLAGLCAVSRTPPSDFADCTPDVYLPVKYGYWRMRLPSQDYFFAEGKGAYYAQAQYAEYRFKNGIVLLARLLDKNLQGL